MTLVLTDESALDGADLEAVRSFARCGECMAITAPELENECPTSEQAATLQWVICAKCKVTGVPPVDI